MVSRVPGLAAAALVFAAVTPVPVRQTTAICGTVSVSGAVVSGAEVSFDGVHGAISDRNGRYLLGVRDVPDVAGLPEGQHALVFSAAGLRTRVVRVTDEWLAGNVRVQAIGAAPCTVLDAALSHRTPDSSSIEAASVLGSMPRDADQDSMDDHIEDWLAERFAPEVFHGTDDTSLPVSVDWWLSHTHLAVKQGSARHRLLTGPLKQEQLLGQTAPLSGNQTLASDVTRSRVKQDTFFLEDVAPEFRGGLRSALTSWPTYVHSFANDAGGITLQYWRAYVWNRATVLLLDFSHGGDWEGIAVHLDAALKPRAVAFLEHAGIVYETTAVQWNGTRPRVWSQEDGHASYPESRRMRSQTFIRQETWTGGNAGGLINVGERLNPRNNQTFIRYAGLWGSPGVLFITSGYWGPAFNETGARCADGSAAYGPGLDHRAALDACGRILLTAWCDGMDRRVQDVARECLAARESQ